MVGSQSGLDFAFTRTDKAFSRLKSVQQQRRLPIGSGQTVSRLYIVALMAQSLEVGPGSWYAGYAAVVMASIIKEVYLVERLSDLATSATE